MFFAESTSGFIDQINKFVIDPNPYRSILILAVSIAVSYWLSKFVARAFIFVAKKVSVRSDNESDALKALRLRQLETYLGVTVAVMRAAVVAVVAYLAWRIITPEGSEQLGGSSAAAIGASAIFIVIAGHTIGSLLRDITAGATMIIEQWFTVGDFIKVEPFIDMSGVVERLTLRSTRLRSLSGEVVWIHNQKIDAVHVTPNGVRTLAVDVFVNDKEAGEKLVTNLVQKMPTGPLLLARRLKVTRTEEWGEELWRIIVEGKTVPGREWLIEKYFVNALTDENGRLEKGVIIGEPIARYADPEADRKFRRAVRVAQEQEKEK